MTAYKITRNKKVPSVYVVSQARDGRTRRIGAFEAAGLADHVVGELERLLETVHRIAEGEAVNAATVLCEIHTKADPVITWTVDMGALPPLGFPADIYVDAWRDLRRIAGMATEAPKEKTPPKDGVDS